MQKAMGNRSTGDRCLRITHKHDPGHSLAPLPAEILPPRIGLPCRASGLMFRVEIEQVPSESHPQKIGHLHFDEDHRKWQECTGDVITEVNRTPILHEAHVIVMYVGCFD